MDRVEYASGVVQRNAEAFELWQVASDLYREAMELPRARPTDLHLVLDMLMLQAHNAHAALWLVAQHSLIEDAATIARRLLEISIQATYIAAEEDQQLRDRKAGRYLSYLWRKLPRGAKALLPTPLRAEWSATARRFGRFVPAKAKRWGPDFRTMFRECNVESLYLTDYSFLSAISHGSPETQILRFAEQVVRAQDERHVSAIVVYGTKYLAVIGEHWNGVYQSVPAPDVDALRTRLVNWRRGAKVRRAAT